MPAADRCLENSVIALYSARRVHVTYSSSTTCSSYRSNSYSMHSIGAILPHWIAPSSGLGMRRTKDGPPLRGNALGWRAERAFHRAPAAASRPQLDPVRRRAQARSRQAKPRTRSGGSDSISNARSRAGSESARHPAATAAGPVAPKRRSQWTMSSAATRRAIHGSDDAAAHHHSGADDLPGTPVPESQRGFPDARRRPRRELRPGSRRGGRPDTLRSLLPHEMCCAGAETPTPLIPRVPAHRTADGIVKLTDYRLFSAFLHETKPLKLRKVAIDNLRRFRSESD